MTAAHFNMLGEQQQLRLTFTFGAGIGDRIAGSYQISLYQLFSFYVEIFTSGENMVCRISGFDDTNRLEPYLDKLDMRELLDNF